MEKPILLNFGNFVKNLLSKIVVAKKVFVAN